MTDDQLIASLIAPLPTEAFNLCDLCAIVINSLNAEVVCHMQKMWHCFSKKEAQSGIYTR